MKQLLIRVDPHVIKALRVYAAQNDTTLQAIGESLYNEFLRQHNLLPSHEVLNRAS